MKTKLTITIIGLACFAALSSEPPKTLQLLRVETSTNIVRRGGPPDRGPNNVAGRPVRQSVTNIVKTAIYAGPDKKEVRVPVAK